MNYKHIVFDIDGTLLDTEEAVLKSLQKTIFQLQNKDLSTNDLRFALGIPGAVTLKKLGIKDVQSANDLWNDNLKDAFHTVNVFNGIKSALDELKRKNYILGIVTSKKKEEYKTDFIPFSIHHYFDYVICADDSKLHKPNPHPMLAYLKTSGANADEVLYVGDSIYDMECALKANVHSALALWGCNSVKHIKANYYLNQPYEIINLLNQNLNPFKDKSWLSIAMELQFISQAGITYCENSFDIERFERLREIAAEMLSIQSGFPIDKVNDIFCNETGFQTPKIDTRAAIFKDDKILLVKEKNGTWSLPGGWVDVNQSIKSNTIKEVKEEAGLDVVPIKLISVLDRNKHNTPIYAYGVCKVFVLCEIIDGSFVKNIETVESRYFNIDELPNLAEEKNSADQIRTCFQGYKSKNWVTLFD